MTIYIIFIADVQKESIAKLRQAITDSVNSGATEIYLAISSSGGNVFEGLSIAALLKALSINVITHNIGQTDSVANVIFASGKKRLSNANSSFLFHGVTNYLNQGFTEHQLLEAYDNTKRLREAITNAFAYYTGIQVSDIDTLMARNGGTILSAREAQAKSIVHDIKELSIPQGAQIISIGNA